MPNHFHLLAREKTGQGVTKLMQRALPSYATYFNEKHGFSGSLFDRGYRCVRVKTEEQLLHLSRYIHLNPKGLVDSLDEYSYSSYSDYLGRRKTSWLKPDYILEQFSKTGYSNSYREFVEKYQETEDEEEIVSSLLLD